MGIPPQRAPQHKGRALGQEERVLTIVHDALGDEITYPPLDVATGPPVGKLQPYAHPSSERESCTRDPPASGSGVVTPDKSKAEDLPIVQGLTVVGRSEAFVQLERSRAERG